MWLRLEVLDQWSWQVCTERVMPVPDGESGAYTHALILMTHPSHAIPHPAMPAMSPLPSRSPSPPCWRTGVPAVQTFGWIICSEVYLPARELAQNGDIWCMGQLTCRHVMLAMMGQRHTR